MVWPGPSSRARRIAPAMLTPRGAADQQAFLDGEIEHDRQRLLVRNLVGEVDRRAFEIGGHAALADALGDRRAGALQFAGRIIGIERRPHRVGERDLDVAVALLERHADAGERAAGADCADEAVELAVEIVENLRARRLVVAAAIGDVVELVRPHRAARLGPGERLGQPTGIAHVIVGIGVGNRGHLDQLGAGEPKEVLLLLRLGVGDDDDGPVAERARHHRDADPGVARGALDDHAARAQRAAMRRRP